MKRVNDYRYSTGEGGWGGAVSAGLYHNPIVSGNRLLLRNKFDQNHCDVSTIFVINDVEC
jgi:hypothetical protein